MALDAELYMCSRKNQTKSMSHLHNKLYNCSKQNPYFWSHNFQVMRMFNINKTLSCIIFSHPHHENYIQAKVNLQNIVVSLIMQHGWGKVLQEKLESSKHFWNGSLESILLK